jgi:hypothetical protein
MRPYAVYLHSSVLAQTPRSGTKRTRVMQFIHSLSEDPFHSGDFQDRDEAGHEIEVKIVGDHAVSYWADHAVREIKVINIQPADKI